MFQLNLQVNCKEDLQKIPTNMRSSRPYSLMGKEKNPIKLKEQGMQNLIIAFLFC